MPKTESLPTWFRFHSSDVPDGPETVYIILDPLKPAAPHNATDLNLKRMQEIVGGYVQCLPIGRHVIHVGTTSQIQSSRSIDLWFNEEARILGLQPNRQLAGMRGRYAQWNGETIFGSALLAASDEETGNTCGLTRTEFHVWYPIVQSFPILLPLEPTPCERCGSIFEGRRGGIMCPKCLDSIDAQHT